MKKYKTWEVIKMLTENPRLNFSQVDEYGVKHVLQVQDEFFYYRQDDALGNMNGNIMITDEWVLLQQPVTFIEAVNAYADGKTIRLERGNRIIGKLIPRKGKSYCTNQDFWVRLYGNAEEESRNLSAIEILEGTWYIEEAE